MSVVVSSHHDARAQKRLAQGEQYSRWPALSSTHPSLSYYDGPSAPRIHYPTPENLHLPARSVRRMSSARTLGSNTELTTYLEQNIVEVFDGPAKPKRPFIRAHRSLAVSL